MKIKRLLLISLMVVGISSVNAQNADNKWGFGGHFGVMEYNGDIKNQFYSFSQGYGLGASISRYLNPSFDVMLHFFYDGERAHDTGRLGAATWLNFYTHMYNTNLLAKYKFNNGYILKENALLAPYLLAGVGVNYAKASGTGENGEFAENYVNPDVYGGIGLNLRISPAFSIVVQTALMCPFTDKLDGVVGDAVTISTKGGDLFLQNSVGVYITPGKAKKKDADGDGVTDKLDKCPDTPAGVAVDANGCPLDTDKDGIYDYLDECPTVAGLKQFNGCPDTDGDGIPDKSDECPDVAGPVALKGCPDSDGDGVIDKDDKCPNTPKGYKVDRFGCPVDSDRDGIPDSEDACPDKAGVSELKGCPFDIKTITAKYNLLMEPILFDFDSYKLKPAGIETLDKISNALSNHKDFGVQFDGHTDYIGTEEYNLKLSENRANSAKDYLINKGISGDRIRLQYFGESKPAQDNKDSKGRAQNRRVEYNLFEIGK
ncbi:MAG: OmpA family protein [Bacteroidota bacterium]